MASVEHSIEVNVPVTTAYNQWTQFEMFPHFMEGVESVHQLDDKHLHWRAKVAGAEREWDAEITEQVPDDRIAWKSTSGARNAGVVTFHRLDPMRTKVMLQLEYEPEGAGEALGDMLGMLTRRVEGDLKHFKEFIEERQAETGAWRGEVKREPVQGEMGRVSG
ncbi:MAG TPA: SRPBCC family protein [Chloroflexota bacterium]|nr:SRPBCC family protein [Chloroflexota bacterium]